MRWINLHEPGTGADADKGVGRVDDGEDDQGDDDGANEFVLHRD